MSIFLIAEAGVNHNGSDELALQLVDMAAASGADAVKFQTFKADKLVRQGTKKAKYQEQQTGDGDQHSMLRQLEMSEELHYKLLQRCQEKNIEFMSTPFDEASADFLLALGMKRIKIPSGEITNHPFLAYLATKDVPLIMSTGMASLDEVQEAVEVIRAAREQAGLTQPLSTILTLLHCTSNYPTAPSDVNLRAMQTMATETGLPVGYSDHTAGFSIPTAAASLGAQVIEKHFTLNRNLPGPDHQASLEPLELAAMVTQIRQVEAALGSPIKQPTPSELPVRDLVRRSVTLTRPLKTGEVIHRSDLTLLRPGTGIPPKDLMRVVGKITVRDLPAGDTLHWTDVQ